MAIAPSPQEIMARLLAEYFKPNGSFRKLAATLIAGPLAKRISGRAKPDKCHRSCLRPLPALSPPYDPLTVPLSSPYSAYSQL